MYEYSSIRYRSFKETNTINSAKEYIARKKMKSSNQSYKGIKKDQKEDFIPGGKLYCK